MAVGLTGAWLAHRRRAALRHAILAASFSVLLLLPIVSMLAPPVRITVPDRANVAAIVAIPAASVQVTVAASVRPSSDLSPSAVLLVMWMGGVVLSLLPMFVGLWRVRSLRHSGLPWADATAMVPTRVEVLVHEAVAGPMTCGVLHPAIVLPADAQTWDAQDLNRALVHELAHVRRGDWLIHCLSRAVCSVYWFHPLVWIAWRKLALEAERSCDDAVLERSDATSYADQLVGLAQRLCVAAKSPVLSMAESRRSGDACSRGPRRPAATGPGGHVCRRARMRGRGGPCPHAVAPENGCRASGGSCIEHAHATFPVRHDDGDR